ncbi:collagen alpha-1(I) chain-like [Mustela erminea]|uniref:collagen alpha-1(I) chain-like n=1 Tax=Mustela erminea TaxID=36723 RepID=UPI0013865FBD|nr:collagen alpha-1(I) chain-like [Mustela erminea]
MTWTWLEGPSAADTGGPGQWPEGRWGPGLLLKRRMFCLCMTCCQVKPALTSDPVWVETAGFWGAGVCVAVSVSARVCSPGCLLQGQRLRPARLLEAVAGLCPSLPGPTVRLGVGWEVVGPVASWGLGVGPHSGGTLGPVKRRAGVGRRELGPDPACLYEVTLGPGARGSVPALSAGPHLLPQLLLRAPTAGASICPRNPSSRRAPVGCQGGGLPGLPVPWLCGPAVSVLLQVPLPVPAPSGGPAEPGSRSSAMRRASRGRPCAPGGRAHEVSRRGSPGPTLRTEQCRGRCGPPGGNKSTGQDGLASSRVILISYFQGRVFRIISAISRKACIKYL